MTIRVYVVEDHAVMRETLIAFLGLDGSIEVCGAAASAERAVEELEAAQPALVVLDLSLPGRSGLELLEEIRARWGYPCLVLSGHGERGYVTRALAAGAGGYVLKGRPEELSTAIHQVLAGTIYRSAALRRDEDAGA